MSVRSIILETLKEKGEVRATDIMQKTNFSRSYIIRYLLELRDEGYIALIGKANQARYVPAGSFGTQKEKVLAYHRMFKNEGLNEDIVISDIRKKTGILNGLKENIGKIFAYGFLEMLNNAIEHSLSERISVLAIKDEHIIRFEITDTGVGIYENIKAKKGYSSELEAIEALIKGKLTTAEKSHSGEGIFFTSKLSDTLIIESGTKKLAFNNILADVFITTRKQKKGTRVRFSLGLENEKELESIFREFADDSLQFNKTEVLVRLYRINNELLSRSIARRVVAGLERFTTVKLDFANIETIGQGFADEVFRVWKGHHPEITIIPINDNENIRFMIGHIQKRSIL